MDSRSRADDYEHASPDVMYTVQNIPGPGANLDELNSEFSTGCSCTDRCTDCACIRGPANYINARLADLDSPSPIIECNPRCSCAASCGNRLVQLGPLDGLEVRGFGPKGLGLACTKPVWRGQFICEYAGELIGVEEARLRVERNRIENTMNYVLVVVEHIGDRTIRTCVDPKYFGNIGRYCNHSCEPSAIILPVRVEGPVPRLCLFAARDLGPGEEVTFNYAGAIGYSVQNRSDSRCLCGCANCAGYLPHHPI